ncbi:TIGR03085 family metal-binding protein [Geodermatophilus sp. DSM 44513]|uniref:TIGR03085 family metal-binding protein n=1 Tax=Geodermatophilus sp. DSM 44513 TaxID=1528104 RepID=UPI00126F5B0A|nr:TIGR03085 family metal-binding protein [Geodermatophilus sp. DSM 44513]WNV77391.1 TIGR03085 family metal-binding protein [Geodermatophilus sp. DSM 44513]
MTSSSRPLAARERAALADLLDELGPDAPTCCAGWTTAHLAAHLVTRDRRPDAAPGFALEATPVGRPLAAWSHTVEDRLRTTTGYADLVARVRSGPPRWLPTSWPPVAALVDTTEYAIHHEDVRRAQPGWAPRELPRAAQDRFWRDALLFGRMAAGPVPGALVLRRGDVPGAERRFGTGTPETVVTGEPLELLLWASGRRDVARVTGG